MADPMNNDQSVKGTFSFVSLGCPKNTVDSERMLGLLAQDGYVLVPEADRADLVIINTCGFIDAARQESLGAIREMLARKKAGAIKGVVVAGCLAERQKEMLLRRSPRSIRSSASSAARKLRGSPTGSWATSTSSAPSFVRRPSRRRMTGRG